MSPSQLHYIGNICLHSMNTVVLKWIHCTVDLLVLSNPNVLIRYWQLLNTQTFCRP